ncbi:Uncharacterised protein [Mycobacteroides abscessus subsp. abscessus]|nr:Uncharacterised protein [Mycobacteroides abscessus subsp. abscessus]
MGIVVAGVPSSPAAGAQPDPRTTATRWAGTPVRVAISAAARAAASSGASRSSASSTRRAGWGYLPRAGASSVTATEPNHDGILI